MTTVVCSTATGIAGGAAFRSERRVRSRSVSGRRNAPPSRCVTVRGWSLDQCDPDPDYAPRSVGATRTTKTDDDRDRVSDSDHDSTPVESSRARSSWTSREATQDASGVDYLVELGRQSPNTNIEVGARYGLVDDVFAGRANKNFNLGADSDIASGKLRYTEMPRTFNNLVGDFHVPQAFQDRVALHLAKNFLSDASNPGVSGTVSGQEKSGALGTTNVPLILGIWGGKGSGKTFNLELSCKAMGVTPVVMSAGELEDEWAGEPGRLVRRRYRKAAELMKNAGQPSCLIVHDIDAGAGVFKQTQNTVNMQMVVGTLMNLCDHPNRVSDESDDEIHDWREEDIVRRVPIIVTGNDLSTLYAPLLRDGRMEKFYWKPSFVDICDMVHAMFKDEDVSRETVTRLVSEYAGQPLDFFGAIRARMYDEAIRAWLEAFRSTSPNEHTGQRFVGKGMGEMLMDKRDRERPDDEEDPGRFIYWRPDFIHRDAEKSGVDMSEANIFAYAADLQREQQLVNDQQLSLEYMRYQKTWDELVAEGKARSDDAPPEKTAEQRLAEDAAYAARRDANKKAADAARAALLESEAAARAEREAWLRANPPLPEPPNPEPLDPEPEPDFPRDWALVAVPECFDAFKNENVPVVDVRGTRDFRRESVVGSINVPAVEITGRPLHWERERLDGFVDAFVEQFPDTDAAIVVVGSCDSETAEDGAAVALARLRDAGFTYRNAAEAAGGYENWVRQYTPAGKKRTGNAKYTNVVGAPGTICAFSEIITQEDGVFEDLMQK